MRKKKLKCDKCPDGIVFYTYSLMKMHVSVKVVKCDKCRHQHDLESVLKLPEYNPKDITWNEKEAMKFGNWLLDTAKTRPHLLLTGNNFDGNGIFVRKPMQDIMALYKTEFKK